MTDRSLTRRFALVLVAALAALAVITQVTPEDEQAPVVEVKNAPVVPEKVERPPPPTPEPDTLLTPPRRAPRLATPIVIDGQIDMLEGTVFKNAQTLIRLRHLARLARDAVCHGEDGLPWNCGLQARAALISALRSNRIRCLAALDAPGEKDAFQCWAGEQDLSRMMVRGGWARPLPFQAAAYGAELEAAMAAKAGVWRGTWPRDEPEPIPVRSSAAGSRP
jgi:hypothetical protein